MQDYAYGTSQKPYEAPTARGVVRVSAFPLKAGAGKSGCEASRIPMQKR